MQLIKLLLINSLGKLVALMLNKCHFLGNGYLRWYMIIFVSCIIVVVFFNYYPLAENIGMYAIICVILGAFFKAIDWVRVYVLEKEPLEYQGIELPIDNEDKDFPYEKCKNKHWWSFLYWSGWIVLLGCSLIVSLFIFAGVNTKQLTWGNLTIFILGTIILGKYFYVVVRDAIKRKNDFEKRHQDKLNKS